MFYFFLIKSPISGLNRNLTREVYEAKLKSLLNSNMEIKNVLQAILGLYMGRTRTIIYSDHRLFLYFLHVLFKAYLLSYL